MSYTPVEALLLTLDSAKSVSGAAIVQSGHAFKVLHKGAVTTQHQRSAFVQHACELAEQLKLPLVVVAEEWDPPRHRRGTKKNGETTQFDQRWTYKTILGIGEGWGWWTAELERFRVRRIERVTPNVWHDALLGKKRPKDSETISKMLRVRVKAELGLDVADHNVCDAICIGLWARYAPSVLEAARKEKKHLLAAEKKNCHP